MAQQCSSCHSQSPDGAKFCQECGTPFARACPACGTPAGSGKFCAECGAPLASGGAPAPVAPATSTAGPVSERRTTSVLFGDLVSFTTLSEQRDPEEVRELLSEYFAAARTVVGRFGGTIEKFIGDAVMAVWGVPVAHEDDAERAVRAGLDLVAEVTALGERVGAPGLAMRVGVVTGSVAVTLGAVNEGMVAGDAVNTAARVQSAAEPSTVWTDSETRSLTSAAIAYSDMGAHTLKGKAEQVQLYRADVAIAGIGGAQRVDGLEAPLTGRDGELRAIKELFHEVEADGRSRLMLIEGQAGTGKTRLGWEFYKYVDGLSRTFAWQRGRCLSYGDGVGFWAFAEMMRSRFGLLEDDDNEQVAAKVREGVAAAATDNSEAEWLAPRLMALLGAGEGGRTFERSDLFTAWSTYLERWAGSDPVVLLFEDMQHADAGLLDFVDYLLENSGAHLFLVLCARPELRGRRGSLATGNRRSLLTLAPLDEIAMADLVDGLVADLPTRARSAIVSRADGVPLYAVETVRSLIDRDAVIPREGRYVFDDPDGSKVDLAQLAAPTSLHTLIAARLDALTAAERRVVQDASVLGLAFRQEGVEQLSDLPAADIDVAMLGLVRKGVIETQLDPRSPELGQYRFLQALVREVAYSTLARKDRKARHLAAADHLASEGEIAETFSGVIAQHLLDALDASSPTDPDRPEVTSRARTLLITAAERAEALGSSEEALRSTIAALTLEPAPPVRELAELQERGARLAAKAGEYERAIGLAVDAAAGYAAIGDELAQDRATVERGNALQLAGRGDEAVQLLRPIYDRLVDRSDIDDVLFTLTRRLSSAYRGTGDLDNDHRVTMTLMNVAERLGDPARLVTALNAVAINLVDSGAPTAYLALMQHCIQISRDEHLVAELGRSLANFIAEVYVRDLPQALELAPEAVAMCREAGDNMYTETAVNNAALTWWLAGEWQLLTATTGEWLDNHPPTSLAASMASAMMFAARETGVALTSMQFPESDSGYEQNGVDLYAALRREAEGDTVSAAADAAASLRRAYGDGSVHDDFEAFWAPVVEMQLAVGDIPTAENLLTLPPALKSQTRGPFARAQSSRLRALVAMCRGEDPEELLREAERAFTAYAAPFYLARTRLELGRWLCEQDRSDEGRPLLDLARTAFVALGAARSLDELDKAQEKVPLTVGVA